MSLQAQTTSSVPKRQPCKGLLASSLCGHESQYQNTLRGTVQCTGIGVHSGEKVTLRLTPAEPNTGIVFLRTDLKNGARTIPARWDYVIDTRLCTVLGNAHSGKVSTIEHLMAALRAEEIDNVVAEIDGPEVPIMDGSAADFMELIEMAGIAKQSAIRQEIIVLKTIEVEENGKLVRLSPADKASYTVDITFANRLIGNQRRDFVLSRKTFKEEISRARTFGFYEDVAKMQEQGLMLGGSLDNAVVIKGDTVMNKDGFRFEDEGVRHKILDSVGDLYLGGNIRAHFEGVCSGHMMNNKLLHALFNDPTAWTMHDEQPETATRL